MSHNPPIDIMEQGIQSFTPPDQDNICLICHDLLVGGEETNENNPPYTLECRHKYHTNCIVTWFRSGHMNCPYCGDLGSNAPKKNKLRANPRRSMFRPWHERVIIESKYERLRQYSRRKDAPDQLVKAVDKLKDIERQCSESKDELKKFINEPIQGETWKAMEKKKNQMRHNIWTLSKKINKQKCVISEYPVIPLIIPRIAT